MLSEGCSSLANLDSIESMRYAILLTLCELSTAAIPIPSECRAVQSDSVNVGHDVITHCALVSTARYLKRLKHGHRTAVTTEM
ncbi:hypothetical protein G6F42_023415 [Rhizopus arrhizus]|nr:hypothetical protein G6F42_023415 [Rhizopus arrhizus]